MRKAFALAAISAVLLRLAPSPALGHDVFTNLYSGGAPGMGQWCCSGDEKTGDCEEVWSNYEMTPDGDALFVSKRYGRTVRVAKDKITWMPLPGTTSEASWCGKPRATMNAQALPPDADQPDPDTWTYCAFIAPGGV